MRSKYVIMALLLLAVLSMPQVAMAQEAATLDELHYVEYTYSSDLGKLISSDKTTTTYKILSKKTEEKKDEEKQEEEGEKGSTQVNTEETTIDLDDASETYIESGFVVVSGDVSYDNTIIIGKNTDSGSGSGGDSGNSATQEGEEEGDEEETKTYEVSLLLLDGATLELKNIQVVSGSKLHIYAQSGDTGKLIVGAGASTQETEDNTEETTPSTAAAIGGAAIGGSGTTTSDPENSGTSTTDEKINPADAGEIYIHGGIISADGSNGGAAIGGGKGGNGGVIVIYNGTVNAATVTTVEAETTETPETNTAEGENDTGAAIGGGANGDGGTITIYSGDVTANSTAVTKTEDNKGETEKTGTAADDPVPAAAGIGGGSNGSGGTITIYGGSVKASGIVGIGGGFKDTEDDKTGDDENENKEEEKKEGEQQQENANATPEGKSHGDLIVNAPMLIKGSADVASAVSLDAPYDPRYAYMEAFKGVFTLTFDTASGDAKAPISLDYGAKIDSTDEAYIPTRTGYKFLKWSPDLPATMPSHDVTVKASWDIGRYWLSFDTDGGTSIDAVSFDYSADITSSDYTTTKDGYTFSKWSPDIPAKMPAEDLEVKAIWTAKKYWLSFDTDGGSEIAPMSYDYGATVTSPDNPTKTGYTFSKWSPDIPSTMPAEDLTVKAIWTVNTYTITFDTDGGSEIATVSYDYGATVTSPDNPTKTGYTFSKWSPDLPSTMPAEDLTVTAIWTVNTYTITFDSNGGTDVDAATYAYGAEVTAPTAPTKTGYTFAGWSPALPETMPAENLTVVAQWTAITYTITFDSNGGSEVDAITAAYGAEITAPDAPTRAGYTFAGWEPALPSTMPAENLTVVAQWTVNSYTITFDTDGGSAIAPITLNYGDTVTPPANPTKYGYTFAGWSPALPTTMVDSDLTVKALWTLATTLPVESVSDLLNMTDAERKEEIESKGGIAITGETTNAELTQLITALATSNASNPVSNPSSKTLNLTDVTGDNLTVTITEAIGFGKIDMTGNSSITTFNASGNTEITEFSCNGSQVEAVSLSGTSYEGGEIKDCANLETLDVANTPAKSNSNSAKELTVANCPNLQEVDAEDGNFDAINLNTADEVSSVSGGNDYDSMVFASSAGSSIIVPAGTTYTAPSLNASGNKLDGIAIGFSDGNGTVSPARNISVRSGVLRLGGQNVVMSRASAILGSLFPSAQLTVTAADTPTLSQLTGAHGRLTDIKAYDASGNEIACQFDAATGTTLYEKYPARVTYTYDTGLELSGSDAMTVDVDLTGTEKPDDWDDVDDREGPGEASGGGCSAGFGLAALAVVAFTIRKRS